jgi:hypothetical protein
LPDKTDFPVCVLFNDGVDAGLFNAMIAPLTEYTNKGVIRCQGESDESRPAIYRELFPVWIQSWRQDWDKGVTLDGNVLSEGVLKGFSVCGEDRIFRWADAEIKGKQVVVSSSAVPKIVAVRYAWVNFPLCNLYNKEGFPAVPFRTDDFE